MTFKITKTTNQFMSLIGQSRYCKCNSNEKKRLYKFHQTSKIIDKLFNHF